MNAAPPVVALVGNLPEQDINFPVPAGIVPVNSANLDIGKFYYQAWTEIEDDYQHTVWHIVQLHEGPDPAIINTERHRFFFQKDGVLKMMMVEIKFTLCFLIGRQRLLSQAMRFRWVLMGNFTDIMCLNNWVVADDGSAEITDATSETDFGYRCS